jgi:hypothetical protein
MERLGNTCSAALQVSMGSVNRGTDWTAHAAHHYLLEHQPQPLLHRERSFAHPLTVQKLLSR